MKKIFLALIFLVLIGATTQLSAMTESQKHYPKSHIVHKGKKHNIISDRDFIELCNLVQEESFDTDKVKIIKAGCLGCNFSCKQAAKLLMFLDFESDKLDALEYISSHIIKDKDILNIIETFSFSSNKDKALKILNKTAKKQ